jgi:hypothetical protein
MSASACELGIYRQCRRDRCDYWKRSALSAWKKETRFYQASTSELYGLVQEVPQGAYTVLSALAYAVVKLYGYLSPKLPTIGLFPCIS